MATRKQYRIDYWMEPPVARWSNSFPLIHMPKGFADGAWAVIRSMYGGNKKWRLVEMQEEKVVDTWNTGTVSTN